MERSRTRVAVFSLLLLGCTALGCSGRTTGSGGLVREGADRPATEDGVVAAAPSEDQAPEGVSDSEHKGAPPTPRGAFVETTVPTSLGQTGVASLQRIHFDFDEHTLGPAAREILAGNAEHLRSRPEARIRIEGHCDDRGTTEYNLALGERRALSAYQYLRDLGIDSDRMSVLSFGETRPLDDRDVEPAWALNRRAEFVAE